MTVKKTKYISRIIWIIDERFFWLCANKKLVTCSQTRKTDESVEQFVTTFVATDFLQNF